MKHKSDCAVHNAPALPVGECDCGVDEILKAINHAGLEATKLNGVAWDGFDAAAFAAALSATGYRIVATK